MPGSGKITLTEITFNKYPNTLDICWTGRLEVVDRRVCFVCFFSELRTSSRKEIEAMSRLPASSNTQPIATHDGILGSQASLPWHKTCFESRPSNSNFSVKLENNGSIVINDHDHFIILVSLVSSVVWCIMIVDTLLKCPARHNNNSLNNASTKFHQDSKPWRCGSLLHRSWASSVSTKLPFCLSQSLDIIPGPVAPYIWHHLTYLLDPLAAIMPKDAKGI